ncbi:MAG: DUF1592 domain-containing protein [Myxococcaceae bacterium]|nr:DUF1592 domain-containing protein [Myxococcaceae bacterium]
MRLAMLSALTGLLVACEGRVVAPGGGDGTAAGIGGTGAGAGGGDEITPVEVILPELPFAGSRAPRLSHVEYENTARDLLGSATTLGLSSAFTPDTTSSTFTNNGADLVVTATQWGDYQTAAEELARRATLNTAALTAAAGGTLPADDAALVAALGRRAFRRALTNEEQASLMTLFGRGPTYYSTQTARLAGARLVLEALLQSPHFLYRVELSSGAGPNVSLNAYELANRLSYGLWQSMPDTALLAAAADGSLLDAAAYSAQVTRMLGDARTGASIQVFHAQLLDQAKYADITRSTTLFPEFSVELRESMRQEQVRFIDAVAIAGNGGIRQLLTEKAAYVDRRLAAVYGLPGTFNDTYQRVALTDGKRGGLLTQVGFLALNASSTESDPIHRGVFVNHKVLCAPLPAPPNMVPPLPRGDPNVPKTLRQRITEFTGAGTCGAGCHSTMINPAGFAFEHYDALGRWRDTDNNLPVDARDSYVFGRERKSYNGGVEMQNVMAEDRMTHDCYARHWLEFLAGRGYAPSDKGLIQRVGKSSLADDLAVRDVLRTLVESEPFKTRAGDM